METKVHGQGQRSARPGRTRREHGDAHEIAARSSWGRGLTRPARKRKTRKAMTPREEFVTLFGENEAMAIEAAAEGHKNGIHDKPGSDAFLWALAICVGFECCTKQRYADHH